MEADYGITGNFKVIESWMNGVKSVIHIPLDLPSSKLISSVDNNSIISNNNVPQDNTIHDGATNNGESEKGSASQAKSPALIDFRQSMQVTPTTINYYRGTVPSVLTPVARPPGLSSSLRLVSQQPQPISFQQNIAQVQAFLSPMEARDGTKRSRFVLQPTFSLQKTGRLELQTPITIHSLRPQLQCTLQRNPFHTMPRTALQQRVQNVMAGARLIQPQQQQQQMTPLFSQQFSININNTNYYDLKHLKTSNIASPPNVTTTIIIDPVDEEQNVQSGATSSQISKKPTVSSPLDKSLGDLANDKLSSKKVAIKRKKDPNWDSNSVASSESNVPGTTSKDDEVILIDENLSPSTTLTSVTTSLASVKQVNRAINSTLESSMQLGAVTCSANSLKVIIRVPKPQVSSTVAPEPCESNLPAVTEAEARPDCTQDLPRESAGNSDAVSNGGFSGTSMKKLSEIDESKKNSTWNVKHNKEKVRSNDLSLGDLVDREVMKHWGGADSTTEEAESPLVSKEFDKGFAQLSDSKSWTSDDSKTIRRNINSNDVSKIRLSFKNKKPKHDHRPISDDKRSGKSHAKTNHRMYVVSEGLPAIETTSQHKDRVPCGNKNKLLDCRLLFAECKVSLERLRMDGLMGINVENAKDLLCCSKKPRRVIIGKESRDKTLSAKKAEAYYQTQTTTKNSKKKKRI